MDTIKKKDKMLRAFYEYRNGSTSTQRDKLLDILMALATLKQIKVALEELNIKV